MSSFTKSDEQVYNLVMELANHSPKWTLCYNSGLPYGVSILINRTKVRLCNQTHNRMIFTMRYIVR